MRDDEPDRADEVGVSPARTWLVLLGAGAAFLSLVLAVQSGWASAPSALGQVREATPVLLLSALSGCAAVSLARVGLSRRVNRAWLVLGLLPAAVAVATRFVGVV